MSHAKGRLSGSTGSESAVDLGFENKNSCALPSSRDDISFKNGRILSILDSEPPDNWREYSKKNWLKKFHIVADRWAQIGAETAIFAYFDVSPS
jgi:hypothetical protein